MIYLLEDRRDRLEQQLKTKLDANKIKTDATIPCNKNELEGNLDKYFPNAELVLVHRSYNFNDERINWFWLKQLFNNNGVPVVIFSGDYSSNVIKENGIINGNINSKDLYRHLSWFISQNDPHNISKLIFGEKFILNDLRIFQDKVYDILFEHSESNVLEKTVLQTLSMYIGTYIRAHELETEKENLKKLLKSEEPLTVGDFKNYIQHIIYRYI